MSLSCLVHFKKLHHLNFQDGIKARFEIMSSIFNLENIAKLPQLSHEAHRLSFAAASTASRRSANP